MAFSVGRGVSGKAGISIAHTVSVMRWSEPVTIYLATGASFGVSRYLCAASRTKSRRRATVEGLAAALIWPLVAAAILFKHLRHGKEDKATGELEARVRVRVEEAGRALVISVNKMLEAVRASRTLEREVLEQTLYALREGAEQYVGLAGMEAEADADATPAAYEMELARVSGRRGEDVLLAGRCVHRRNVSRIKARYESERSRLLRKLAALPMEEGNSATSNPADADRAERPKMSEARLEIYLRAADLFSLLEDERAARSAAQLVDAECSYLRRFREANEEAEGAPAPGEEKCTGHKPQLIYKDPLRATTFTQG
ncbi:MAG TPA: hypothetical protein VGC66_17035 [Pyrinomonadaceae bacterium]